MKYIVRINYTKFCFNDGTTAISFAEIAKNYAMEDVNVEVEIEKGQPIDLIDDLAEEEI